MEQTRKSPRTETGTRTFSKECVVTTDDGAEIAVAAMSITTLRGFQEEHIEMVLSEFAKISRAFYLETGNALKMNAAPAPEAQERQSADKTINASERESLIHQYEKRLEKLKAGASPTNVIL